MSETKTKGRPPTDPDIRAKAERMFADRVPIPEIITECGVSQATIYTWRSVWEAKNSPAPLNPEAAA